MDFGKLSNKGNVRLENQDRVAILNNGDFTFLILCDGMGGHFGGSLASSIALKTFTNNFMNFLPKYNQNSNFEEYVTWFKKTCDFARNEMIIFSNNDEAKLDMGTTITAALVNKKENFILIFNIGDSRTYILTTQGELKQITVDHNLLNLFIKDKIPEHIARKNKRHAALTSALGPLKTTKIEVFPIFNNSFESVYSILSTSDGVHDFIDKPILEMILKKHNNAQEIVEEIVDYSLKNHSTDNSSAGLIILDNSKKWGK
ncbi:Serine/threonine phosphatase stp [Mycoplasmopsis maculosa]|uniref:Serine/threonine phosphatase stp n=1 Tax=Mycoplasmopsis maculosa TaxID=114885 RepID=A0A449B4I9_9BACT|nr:protein phosphatase 2C domain-containing protein [Mycoplasmopsis maculosa]VEU75489.1 Serine/threonine phosphatase stp [Mycoplasmopsis maculosa]